MVLSPWFWITLLIAVPLYWLSAPRYRNLILIATSLTFIGSLSVAAAVGAVVLAVIFWTTARPRDRSAGRKRTVIGPLIALAIAYLLLGKYLPSLREGGWLHAKTPLVVSAVGVSYVAFKLMHFAIECVRGGLKGRSFQSYLAWILLFPTFTAGPIEQYDHFLKSRRAEFSPEYLWVGATRIMRGLVKKYAIGEAIIGEWLLRGESLRASLEHADAMPTWRAWAVLVLFFWYFYFDFAAYSDIAIGASRLFGIRIMENFRWPILASNIGDFWQRWHMTLTAWSLRYVYLPLVGRTRDPWIATYVAFIVMGAWHGLTLGWLGWGVYHATGISVLRLWQRLRTRLGMRPPTHWAARIPGIVLTTLFVSCGTLVVSIDSENGPQIVVGYLKRLFFIC